MVLNQPTIRADHVAYAIAALALLLIPILFFSGYLMWRSEAEVRAAHHERLKGLRLGMTLDEVSASFGKPDRICQGGQSVKLHRGQVRRVWFGVGGQAVVERLEAQTAHTWVYYSRPRDDSTGSRCGAEYSDAELGFSHHGVVVWYIVEAHESYLQY